MKSKIKSRSARKQSPLKNWKAYKDFYHSLPEGNHLEKPNRTLNRFEARYSLASKFRGIKAEEISNKTLRGYEAGLKLMLSYTAAELLCSAIGKNINSLKIEDRDLAKDIRSMLNRYKKIPDPEVELLREISKVITNPTLINEFDIFMNDNKIDNVRVIASVLRITMAHGLYSPYAFDVAKSSDAAIIHNLSSAVLIKCQQEFSDWFEMQTTETSN